MTSRGLERLVIEGSACLHRSSLQGEPGFRWGNSARKFSQIDDYVRERLALFDSKKRQRSGRRWEEVHSKAWFRRHGCITPLWDGPLYLICDSAHVNTVGEPCARKPHARFDEGRLARRLAEPVAYSTRT
jgi:hypothetical protein